MMSLFSTLRGTRARMILLTQEANYRIRKNDKSTVLR